MFEFCRNCRFGSRLAIIVGATVAAFAVYGWYSYATLAQVKVSGPLYQRIAQGDGMLADVLPPDMYLVEAYLSAFEVLEDHPDRINARVRSMRASLDRFRARDEYWIGNLQDPDLKSILQVDVCYPGRALVTLLDKEFIPAVIAGDKVTARALLLGPLGDRFREHRAGVDSLARHIRERNRSHESVVEAMVRQRMLGQLGIGLLLVAALAAACFRIVWVSEVRAKRRVYGMLTGETPLSPDIRDKVIWN